MKKITKKLKQEIRIVENYQNEIELAIVLKTKYGDFWEYVNITESGKYRLELIDFNFGAGLNNFGYSLDDIKLAFIEFLEKENEKLDIVTTQKRQVFSWQFVADVLYKGNITKMIDDMQKSYENSVIKNNIKLAKKLVKSIDKAKRERAKNRLLD